MIDLVWKFCCEDTPSLGENMQPVVYITFLRKGPSILWPPLFRKIDAIMFPVSLNVGSFFVSSLF